MKLKLALGGAAAAVLAASIAIADLEPWKDYTVSDTVWSVTTIRVDPNMDDAYLEGIEKTWAAGNEVAKKLGQIKDYAIYRSELPQSGEFNLLLVIEFEKASDLEPNEKRYNDFIEEWGKANADASTDFAQENYPAMREITGQYRMRKIELQ